MNKILIDSDEKTAVGLVLTCYGQHLLIQTKSGRLLKCTRRKNVGSCVAGDRVIFDEIDQNNALIIKLLKRDNYLTRQQKLIVANVDQLWLMVASEPHYQFELIDRYLIMAENAYLPIGIIVNKIDSFKKIEAIKKDLFIYHNIRYPIFYLSAKKRLNLAQFRQTLKDKTHILLGQSGVGKSSLINALNPNLDLTVAKLSKTTGLGKHTTTSTTLYHIPTGGRLIDSPGIREFQLDDFTNAQILNGFREFKRFSQQCQFRNCWHINEPNCGVKNALEKGLISHKRFENYCALINH